MRCHVKVVEVHFNRVRCIRSENDRVAVEVGGAYDLYWEISWFESPPGHRQF